MNVNFDGFRKSGVAAYNSLVKELNSRIQEDGETLGKSRVNGDSFCTGDIYDEMKNIRDCLATLICLEDKENGIKCLDLKLDVFAPDV